MTALTFGQIEKNLSSIVDSLAGTRGVLDTIPVQAAQRKAAMDAIPTQLKQTIEDITQAAADQPDNAYVQGLKGKVDVLFAECAALSARSDQSTKPRLSYR